MTHRRLSFLSLHFGLVLACTTVLSAQLNRGTIEGTVTDPQGATLSGVDVSITSVDTNVVTTTTTNSAGYYRGELWCRAPTVPTSQPRDSRCWT